MPNTVRVGLLQQRCKPRDKVYNLRRFVEMAREAAASGAQILCAPEGMLDGYPTPYSRQTSEQMAEDRDGPAVTRMRELARELEVTLVAGFTLRAGERLLNSVAVCGPGGELLGTYSKVHLHTPSGEDRGYDHGDAFGVFNSCGVPFGVMICYDRRVLESARVLRLMGADIVFNPSQTARFGSGVKSTHTAIMRANAYFNRVFVVSVNSAERKGGSMVVGPDGNVKYRLGRGEKVGICDLDLQDLSELRQIEDFVRDRVPAAYGILLQE